MNIKEQLINFTDKVVFISGVNGQLGSVFARVFNELGALVVGVDIHPDTHHDFLKDYYNLNITSQEQVKAVFSSIYNWAGKIDCLINNAGVSVFEPFEKRTQESLDYVMDVNLKGAFWLIQTYVNEFDRHKQGKGAIVNIASLYGVVSPDFRIYTDCERKNSEIYGATKAGLIQMTRYFGVHLARRNIRVNAVSPGGIYNPEQPQGEDFVKNYSYRCPMGRMANADEIAGAVVYLASEAASYTTGHNLIVDGAFSEW